MPREKQIAHRVLAAWPKSQTAADFDAAPPGSIERSASGARRDGVQAQRLPGEIQFESLRNVFGMVPHSGQRSGVARRSYPHLGQIPAGVIFLSNARLAS